VIERVYRVMGGVVMERKGVGKVRVWMWMRMWWVRLKGWVEN
jgi:hypothetical protein